MSNTFVFVWEEHDGWYFAFDLSHCDKKKGSGPFLNENSAWSFARKALAGGEES